MSKGKAKGFKKAMVRIQEPQMGSYYVLGDEAQFTLMKEGSTIPVGYYSTLKGVVRAMSKRLSVEQPTKVSLTLGEYVDRYETITNNLINSINL